MNTQPSSAPPACAQAAASTPALSQGVSPSATGGRREPSAVPAATPSPCAGRPQPSTPVALESSHACASRLMDLPTETIDLLASHLPPRDLLRFACASRQTHAIAADRLRSMALCAKARQVVSERTVNSILASIEQLPKSLRGAPLTALARRGTHVMPMIQESVFRLILKAVPELTDGGRACVLAELAHLLGTLSCQAHALGFDPFWGELKRLRATARGQCLPTLAARLPEGAPSIALRAFTRIREEAIQLAPALGTVLLNQLARQLELLPTSHRLLACEQLLSSSWQINSINLVDPPTGISGQQIDETILSSRAELFDILMWHLGSLPSADRSALFERLLVLCLQFPPHRRARILTLMTWQLRAVKPAPERLGKFNAVLEMTQDLPLDSRHTVLIALAWASTELSNAPMEALFRTLTTEACRLSPPSRGPVLIMLAHHLPALPQLERLSMFDELFTEASRLPPLQARDLWLALHSRISALLPLDQATAMSRIAVALRGVQP